jgi:O-antigen/teichoic acid export membrane protein
MLVMIRISLPVWQKEGLKLLCRISKPIFREIFLLGLAIFVCAAMFYGVMQFLRSQLLSLHGEEAAGYFHAGLQMVSYFYILAQALTLYLVPRMSENLEKKILEKEVNDAWRLGTLCLMVLAPILVLFGDLFVRLLLSLQFRTIEQFLAILAAIELLRIGGVVLGSTIIAQGNQWIYILVNLCFIIPAITAGMLLIPEYGLTGAMMAYCLAWICNILAATIAINSRISISLHVSNMLLPLKGLILIIIAANCANFSYILRIAILCLLMVLASTSIKGSEFEAAFQLMQDRFNRVRSVIFEREE